MKTVFIYGPPGVGKLTVAEELSKVTGYKLFHNHLAVDLANSVFDFGTKPFIELREKAWLMVIEKAIQEKINGLIFTFVFEESVSPQFIDKLINLLNKKNNQTYFIKLICTPEELKKRIINPSRNKYSKVKKIDDVEEYYKRDYLVQKEIVEKTLIIENTSLSATDTAKKIIYNYNLNTTEL